MAHVVTAPLVQAKRSDGSYVHVYEGGLLPSDVDEDQLQHLLESDMVEASDDPAASEDDDGRPAKSAHKADWEAFAASVGIDTDGLTKEEIIEAVEARED